MSWRAHTVYTYNTATQKHESLGDFSIPILGGTTPPECRPAQAHLSELNSTNVEHCTVGSHWRFGVEIPRHPRWIGQERHNEQSLKLNNITRPSIITMALQELENTKQDVEIVTWPYKHADNIRICSSILCSFYILMEGVGEGERAVAWLEEIMARYNTKLFEKVPMYDTGVCIHTNYNCIHKATLLYINTA